MPNFSSLYGALLDRELGSADSTILFTTAKRKQAINEGIRTFADFTECLTVQSSLTLGQSTAVVSAEGTGGERDLHSSNVLTNRDFSRRAAQAVQYRHTDSAGTVTILQGPDLPYRDILWLDQERPGWPVSTTGSTSRQDPECYYLRPQGGALWLGFYPYPVVQTSQTASAILPYVAIPAPLTSDTQEPFEYNGAVRVDLRPYHQAAVHYGAAQLENLRRDVDRSRLQMQMFTQYVARYVASLRDKGGRAVRFLRRPFTPARYTERGTDPRR